MGFPEVEVHDNRFSKYAPDPVWLLDIGRRNWRALTGDHDLVFRHREAIIQGNVGLFVLADLKRGESWHKWAEMIRGCQQRIVHACTAANRPFVARISRTGQLWEIKRLLPHHKDDDVTSEIAAHARGFGIL